MFDDPACDILEESISGYPAELCRPVNSNGKYAMRIKDVTVKLFDETEFQFELTIGKVSTDQMEEELALCIFRSFQLLCYEDTGDCFFD